MTVGDVVSAAILGGRTDLVQQLLNEGLDPNTIVRNVPILLIAATYDKTNIVKLLLDRGADPNIRKRGETALFLSTNSDIVDSLIRHGADVDIKNDYGETPLSYFAKSGDIPRIKLLVSKGADVNTTDNNGETLLMKAAARGREVIELLLKLGVNPNAKDNSGNKASDYALSQPEKFILHMAEKRYTKKMFPSTHGRVAPYWMEICNTLGNAGIYGLRKVIADHVDKRNFDFVAQFFATFPFDDVIEFLDYIQGLNKREICAGLAKYYTATKPEFLSVEYRRGSVRPISEMARKSIQRRKASLYSLTYRKARQADPEKFREYVSQFDLPNP
jgi:hypothetical protein